jgi:hypothetical protein
MLRLRRACVLVALPVALAAAGAAAAADPAPDTLVLAPADLPGTTVAFSGTLPGTTEYARVFLPTRSGGSVVDSLVVLHPDEPTAAATIAGLRAYAQTPPGRRALGKAMSDGVRSLLASRAFRAKFGIVGKFTVSNAVVGRASEPAADAVVLPNTVKVNGHAIHIQLAFVLVDRAIDSVELINEQTAPSASALLSLIARARSRMRLGFTVANTGVPTITGIPAVGQTLTPDNGSWNGGPSSFTYTWERCAADGTACAPVDGATNASYTVSTVDEGSTIRVVVSGANTVSNAQATSVQTVVVP